MKKILILSMLLLAGSALASSFNVGQTKRLIGMTSHLKAIEFCDDSSFAWSCEEKRVFSTGVNAAAITVGFATSCLLATTPLTVPATAGVLVASGGLATLSFVLELMPCDDIKSKKDAANMMCKLLRANGLQCDSRTIDVILD